MVVSWMKRRVLIPVRIALKNGISHKRLATSLALGITLGLIPFYGMTTLLVGFVAIAFRLDFVMMQVVHYIVHPIQILLLIPFFKIGNMLVMQNSVDFTFREYIALFKSNFWMALSELWKLNLSAIVVWGILSIPLFILLYRLFLASLIRFAPVPVRKPFCKG
jgi:uncharacterized protein (DUF2062 family)